jgi:hypothetical protein
MGKLRVHSKLEAVASRCAQAGRATAGDDRLY